MNLKKIKEQLPTQKYNLYCDQRIEKGYCDYDLADFDDYFLRLLPAALYELASKKDHYPDKLFNSFEQYQKFLQDLAADFRLVDNLTRIDAHSLEAQTLLESAFSKLAKVFWTLWI